MNYHGFGYTVDSCPRNLSEFRSSASRLNCGVDEFNRNQYTCVPNDDLSAIVEFCYNKVVAFFEKEHCLVVFNNGHLDQKSCQMFRKGCPSAHFRSNKFYEYPACHEINREERCFYAEPACPNVSSTNSFLVGESTISTGISNTTLFSNETENIPKNGSICLNSAWLFITFLIVAVIILGSIIVLIYKKRKRKEGHDEEEMNDLLPKEKRLPSFCGDFSLLKVDSPETFIPADRGTFDVEQDFRKYIGKYNVWKSKISEKFYKLSSDQKAVLFCFIYSDHGALEFTHRNEMFVLNVTRRKTFDQHDKLTERKAQQTLESLKSSEFLVVNDQDGFHITEDTEDEIVYLIVSRSPSNNDFNLFLFSFNITRRYFRSRGYNRKPGEKCIISPVSVLDCIIIRRLQMDILNHVTMEDQLIHNEIYQLLNIPDKILKQDKKDRQKFIEDLKLKGQPMNNRSGYHNHVQWLARYWRPDIVRSCVGLFPHCDIYIINNMAYRISNKYHDYPETVRSLLYCLLLTNDYTMDVKEESHENLLKKVRERYFPNLAAISNEDIVTSLPNDLTQAEDGVIEFPSEKIRHDAMYAFITECLVEDNDLDFFLKVASHRVVSEYCRSWKYQRREDERCLYIPDRPREMYDLFIDKLQLDIINHCTVSDRSIHSRISELLSVPREILEWDHQARMRFVSIAGSGMQVVHHARGMIVGCAGAGKTTLLMRLHKRSKDEILKVTPTEGLEVNKGKFYICDEEETLIARPSESTHSDENEEESSRKTLTFFDFGGQCAYYACHQIYLTRRAFYIVVVDASKHLDDVVDEKVCDQANSVFSEWTYSDYFVFWIKSIHTYSGTDTEENHRPYVIIVATHWEIQRLYKSQEEFIEVLQSKIPRNSHLLQYIREDHCFFTQFPIKPLDELEKFIMEIVKDKKWEEKNPKQWDYFDIEISQKKKKMQIMSVSDIAARHTEKVGNGSDAKNDMLRFYHETGKVLFFDEKGLNESVIIDIQWFIDAFKNIITDKLHMKGIPGSRENWDDYYETGNLKDELLTEIWKQNDTKHCQIADNENKASKDDILNNIESEIPEDAFFKPGIHPSGDQSKPDPPKDPRNFVHFKTTILDYMQRLGLIAKGEVSHYIPCMNRRIFDKEMLKIINETKNKTSILIYQFEFLPYFFFFRLVVACMQKKDWKVLKSQEKPCLYRNAALFLLSDHHIVIAATPTSIQLQAYQPKLECSLNAKKTIRIRGYIEKKLTEITTTFHRRVEFVKGFSCKNLDDQSITMDFDRHFIPEHDIVGKDTELCPLHQFVDRHIVDTNKLTKYWNKKSPMDRIKRLC